MKNKYKLFAVAAVVLLFSGAAAAQKGQYTNLSIEKHYSEPEPLQAGEYADIWIRATNTGNAVAEKPVFKLQESFPFSLTGRTEWRVDGGLNPGDTYTIRAQVKVSENAVFGKNDLEILKSTNGGKTTVTDEVSLEVRADDRSLFVSDLGFSERVEPGSSAEMTLTLENQAESLFRNIDVSLDTSGIPVATRETSRKRVSSIESGSSENVPFTLDVDGDADNQLHNLPIKIKYQDQAGNELEMTETTGVNIGGYPNLDVAIEESDIRGPGKGKVTFRVINKGEGRARFTEIKLEETEQFEILSEESIYLGSMIADDFQTAEYEVYVNATDEIELPVSLSYRDGDGDQNEQFDITRELYSKSELRRYGLADSGGSIVPVLMLMVLIGGGLYYWRRRKS